MAVTFRNSCFSLFRIKISKKELLFQGRYFCIAPIFSEKLHFGKKIFQKSNIPHNLIFLENFFCSKLHHRWLKKVRCQTLWNCQFMMKLLFDCTSFSEALFFKDPCFFKNTVFRTANFRLLTLSSHLHFLIII